MADTDITLLRTIWFLADIRGNHNDSGTLGLRVRKATDCATQIPPIYIRSNH